MIPVMKPKLASFESLRPFLERIDQSSIYSNFGPLSWDLRVEYSKYLQVPPEHIVPLANATLAIQGCLEILEQENWIIPDYTFAATACAAVSAKKHIYIADVRDDNFQLEFPVNIMRNDFGVIPVMPFGAPIVFEDWQGIDSLVIDAAASLGTTPPNFAEMPLNSMVVYSLHATKVLGAGEGAIVICENEKLAKKLRAWSNFGFDGSRDSVMHGTNAKISEYSCAIALASISSFQTEKVDWENRLQYVQNLDYPKKLRTIVDNYPGFRPYWIIQLESLIEKENLVHYLNGKQIETRSWWGTPISKMSAFSSLIKFSDGTNSKYFSETHLGLPIWKGIEDQQLEYISQSLRNYFM
jgi:dTDP-4-amino-4,6-dideoxygalactose transaminase